MIPNPHNRIITAVTKFLASLTVALCFGATAWAEPKWRIEGTPRAVTQVINGYLEQVKAPCPPTREDRLNIRQSLRDALDAVGYFSASTRLTITDKDICTIDIALGQRVSIASWKTEFVDTTSTTPTVAHALSATKKVGDTFDPQAYDKIRNRFLSDLQDGGYVDAKMQFSEAKVDLENQHVDITWRVDTGPQYLVDPLRIEQDVLTDDLVKKFLEFSVGDPLNAKKLLASYENLLSSDYYASVRVTPIMSERASGRIPVNIRATPAKQWAYLVGPGFSTDTGPRFRAEANARYLNQHGHRSSFTSLFSPVSGFVKADYRWPYGDPNHQWYSVESRFNYEDTETSKSQTAALGLQRTTRLSNHWTQTTYLDYSVEEFDISAQEGVSQLLILGSNFTYTSTVDAPRPRQGQRLSIDVRGGSDALISDNSVLQVRLRAKQILPFIQRSRLLLRAEIGYSWQDEFDELPASLRFFAGGDKSLRGYALESLGPEDDTGRVIGGDRLLVGSAEIDFPVRKNWSAALFTDVGSAYRDTPEFSHSVGVGVRWYSPLGPIRLDLAHPLDTSDQIVRLHISLGPDL